MIFTYIIHKIVDMSAIKIAVLYIGIVIIRYFYNIHRATFIYHIRKIAQLTQFDRPICFIERKMMVCKRVNELFCLNITSSFDD